MRLHAVSTRTRLHTNKQDLPNAITALSKLMYTPPDPFLRRLVSRARAKLTSFNSQALCNFIFGLCKLAHDPVRASFDLQCLCLCTQSINSKTRVTYNIL